jgi:hypothetical protein
LKNTTRYRHAPRLQPFASNGLKPVSLLLYTSRLFLKVWMMSGPWS